MKLLFTSLFLFLALYVSGQKTLFETLKIDSTTRIIGRYPQYDKSKTYEKYNFIIEDSMMIVEFINSLKLGSEVANSIGPSEFKLTVVKNYRETGSWTINPNLKTVMTHDGHSYEFDPEQISNLNKKYPFAYDYEIKVFKSPAEYDKYLAEQKLRPNFLFDYAPQFKYEGSFEIEFPKNKKFPHPKAISDFLMPLIEKIVNKRDYTLGYELSSRNMSKMNQFTMTIQGPRKLFDQLKVEGLKNENWQPTVEDAFFFYKK